MYKKGKRRYGEEDAEKHAKKGKLSVSRCNMAQGPVNNLNFKD
jgi:hypothetical protein